MGIASSKAVSFPLLLIALPCAPVEERLKRANPSRKMSISSYIRLLLFFIFTSFVARVHYFLVIAPLLTGFFSFSLSRASSMILQPSSPVPPLVVLHSGNLNADARHAHPPSEL